MGLAIRTTGIENYAPGGNARLQIMLIGGPGAGKTRLSSFFPKPIFANIEGGLASVADRQVPYVDVRTSQEMFDLLAEMQIECRQDMPRRRFQTIVIDTLDAFQRKVKDEYLRANPGMQSFRGFDAWGYLDAKMQMLMTRLLNLDMNVVVLVHYKDKVIKEGTGESASERQELMLQLSGDIKDTAFNDFDLVGWLGHYYEAVDGVRTKKRGITFQDTPERPFLKDRFNVMPTWMEITLSDSDYANLFERYISRLDNLQEGQTIGEIQSAPDTVVSGELAGGPVPAADPQEVPLEQQDKTTLQKMARSLGLTFKGNTLKSELVQLIQTAQAEQKDKPADPTPTSETSSATPASSPAAAASPINSASSAGSVNGASSEKSDASSASQVAAPAPVSAVAEAAQQVNEAVVAAPKSQLRSTQEPTGTPGEAVSRATGVISKTEPEVPEAQAIENVVNGLGAEVISQTAGTDNTPQSQPVSPAPAPKVERREAPAGAPSQATNCEDCGKPLADENQDYVRLSWIKWRVHCCNACYKTRKAAA